MKKLLALLALTFLAATSFAATWDMYGSVRVKSFYENPDKYVSGLGESDLDLSFGLQGNSRVGANVKATDKLSATVELGVNESNVTTRLMYATYDFGGAKLRIGQDYTPADYFAPFNRVHGDDNDLMGWGSLYEGRLSQIKLMFPFGLDVAIVKPNATDTVKYDVTMPKFEAAYNAKLGAVTLTALGAYQGYSAETESATTFDSTSYVAGLAAKGNFGPAMFVALGWLGSNTKALGMNNSGKALQDPTKDDDTSDLGFALTAGFKASEMLTVEAGYGYIQSDRDGLKSADKAQSYYVNATVTVGKGFTIVPEIGVEDYMKSTSDAKQGKNIYYGAKWQMNF